jgi:single-stranded-DNA-specific exonuclease
LPKADRIWESLRCDETAASTLSHELRVSPVTARLLSIRGLDDPLSARRFLFPSLDDLLDPNQLTDLPVAVDRIMAAIANKDLIAIHGDYDVDGVTSTVILRRALELLGAEVTHFIPERLRDGYGLQPSSLERLHALGVRLVISVDCGIRGVEAASRARTNRIPSCLARWPSSIPSDTIAPIPTRTLPAWVWR